MKKGRFTKVFLCFCLWALLLAMSSISLAGKPVTTYTSRPGYIMFRDRGQDVIQSDGQGVYMDCGITDGTDMVEVCTWDDGTFKYICFYPGVIQKPFYKCEKGTFSPRRVKFKFNVSGILNQATGNAVLDILRWYRNESGTLTERSANGFIDDDSLHAPMCIYRTGHSDLQFAIDPSPNEDPGIIDPKAVTQNTVDAYYLDDNDIVYWCTRTEPDYEPKPYVIYNLDYGDQEGFEVLNVEWGKTWIVRTKPRRKNNPVRLYVIKDDYYGQKVYLTEYRELPFEFAVSTEPFPNNEYPSIDQAPPKIDNISTTWGEVKEEQ